MTLFQSAFWLRNLPTLSHISRQCLSTDVQILVSPKISLVDEEVNTVVTGLSPGQRVSLKLEVTNCSNLNYASLNKYQVPDSGILDLSRTAPYNRNWSKTDPMSIFWSMTPQEKSDQRFWSVNVDYGLDCKFQLFDGDLTSEEVKNADPIAVSENVKRNYLAEGVTRIQIEHGRVRGTLFLPPGEGPFPSVIKLYGGIHRGQVIEDKAALLASRGFVSLSLAFFGISDLPTTYLTQPIDLDYFEEAVDFLLALKQVDSTKGVGVCGISKGGEIALLLAAYLSHKVSSVAVLNSMITCGIITTVYKGKTVLPGFQLDIGAIRMVEENLYDIGPMIGDIRKQKETLIPFFQSCCRILIVAGEDDKCCNSAEQADLAEELMIEAGKNNYKILKYPGLGHLLDLPFAPPTTITNHALFPKGSKLIMGGDDLQKHAHAQTLAWQHIVEFFRN